MLRNAFKDDSLAKAEIKYLIKLLEDEDISVGSDACFGKFRTYEDWKMYSTCDKQFTKTQLHQLETKKKHGIS